MVLVPHMLVGAAIGSQVSNYWLAFLFGLMSHYLLDSLPHWDYLQKFKISNPTHIKKVAIDFLIGSVLILYLTWSNPNKIIIFVAVFAAILPDAMNGIYMNYKNKWLKHHFLLHNKIHFYKKLSFLQGLIPTLIVVFLSIYVLLL